MLSIPVLAVGVVGTALGLVVAEFRRRVGPPTVPLALFAAVATNGQAAEAEANRRVDEAHAAMGVLAQELSDDRRALAQARDDLELAEEDLALAHVETRQAQLGLVLLVAENERLRDDPPWMQQPIAAFAPVELGGNVVLLDHRTGFR